MDAPEELAARAKAFIVHTSVARVGHVHAMGAAQLRSSLDALLEDCSADEALARVYAVCSMYATAVAELAESLAVDIVDRDEGPLSEFQRALALQWAEHWICDVVEHLDSCAIVDPD